VKGYLQASEQSVSSPAALDPLNGGIIKPPGRPGVEEWRRDSNSDPWDWPLLGWMHWQEDEGGKRRRENEGIFICGTAESALTASG
jgi:hypothetical protein